jgi:hypothetical protein
MRMLALLTSVMFLIAVVAAAAIEPGIGDATATLLFGVPYRTPIRDRSPDETSFVGRAKPTTSVSLLKAVNRGE